MVGLTGRRLFDFLARGIEADFLFVFFDEVSGCWGVFGEDAHDGLGRCALPGYRCVCERGVRVRDELGWIGDVAFCKDVMERLQLLRRGDVIVDRRPHATAP